MRARVSGGAVRGEAGIHDLLSLSARGAGPDEHSDGELRDGIRRTKKRERRARDAVGLGLGTQVIVRKDNLGSMRARVGPDLSVFANAGARMTPSRTP